MLRTHGFHAHQFKPEGHCTQRLTGALEGHAQGGGGRKRRSSTGTQQIGPVSESAGKS